MCKICKCIMVFYKYELHLHSSFFYYMSYENLSISPYTIFARYNAGSPDLHIVGGQILHVFGSSTYGECHCFGPFQFHSLCGSNESKTLLFFNSRLNSQCCCSFAYFCKRMKIFLGAKKYHHFECLSFF